MNKLEAKNSMNLMGSQKRPFFFMVDFEMNTPYVRSLDELDEDILYDINGQSNFDNYKNTNRQVQYSCTPFSKELYKSQYENVLAELNYGNSFLLNLTARHKFMTEDSLKEIFLLAKAKYKLYYNKSIYRFLSRNICKNKERPDFF